MNFPSSVDNASCCRSLYALSKAIKELDAAWKNLSESSAITKVEKEIVIIQKNILLKRILDLSEDTNFIAFEFFTVLTKFRPLVSQLLSIPSYLWLQMINFISSQFRDDRL